MPLFASRCFTKYTSIRSRSINLYKYIWLISFFFFYTTSIGWIQHPSLRYVTWKNVTRKNVYLYILIMTCVLLLTWHIVDIQFETFTPFYVSLLSSPPFHSFSRIVTFSLINFFDPVEIAIVLLMCSRNVGFIAEWILKRKKTLLVQHLLESRITLYDRISNLMMLDHPIRRFILV